ncbi:MAG: response regulator [Terriglobales bacterium]
MNIARSRLLVVDDEEALLLSYRLILEQKGYSVSTARTSAEAESLLASERYDLLLCDLSLERQTSGLDVIRSARRNDPRLGCVLLTGYPDTEISDLAQNDGVHILFKPVEVSKLLETVEFMLRRRRAEERAS